LPPDISLAHGAGTVAGINSHRVSRPSAILAGLFSASTAF
jgi:hypothetical protein